MNAVVVGVGGLAIGALTSVAQGALPEGLGPLANSAGSWSLAAFALCLPNRSPRRGAILGFISLAAMVAGYAIVTSTRGFPVGTRLWLFWGIAAAVVGPVLGIGASWVRASEPNRVAAGAAAIAGILIGEGAYGLARIADTTPPAYWVVQVVLGIALLVVVGAGRIRRLGPIGASVALAAVVAAAVYGAYVSNPVGLIG